MSEGLVGFFEAGLSDRVRALVGQAAAVRLLVCDVDGVLTDGSLFFDDDGEHFKVFHVHDGLGLKLLMRAGIEVAIITARSSPIVANRARQLGIEHVFQGQEDKQEAYSSLLSQFRLEASQVAYIGDDLPDLPLIRRSGLGVCVPQAPSVIQQYADFVTVASAGHGAVRELVDFILFAQGKLVESVQHYDATIV